MLHAELAYIVNVAEPLANGVCRPRMGWGRWKVRGEGPKSLLFGGGARGGVARIVKKMIIGMTLKIHIFAQIEYIWALKSRPLHLQKNALNIESRRREPPVVWIC